MRSEILRKVKFLPMFFLLGCAGPQVAVHKSFDFSQVNRVAVLRFSGEGGEAAADLLAQHLLAAGVELVERERLEAVLQEQRLGASGAMSPQTAKRLGKLLGVDALFAGTVTAYSPAQNYLIYSRKKVTPVSGKVYPQGPAPAVSKSEGEVLTSAASVGLAARMVDVETGTVVWAANQTYEGFDVPSTMSSICFSFVKSLKPFWAQLSK